MKRLKGIIAGTSLLDSSIFKNWNETPVETPYGKVMARRTGEFLFVQRHGPKLVPPHRINHHANVWALRSLGVEQAIAVNSVGSLKTAVKPGTFVIPDDFISPWNIPTFYDHEMRFTVPVFDRDLAKKLYGVCQTLGLTIQAGGVYIQTTGPRFETRAEIELFRKWGDVVGMTMASEATLCMEYSIPYASLCSVDNFCHGISKVPLSIEEVKENVQRNRDAIEMVMHEVLTGGLK